MKKNSDGRRKSRVEKEVQLVVSEFIIHHLRNELPGLVTLTRVQMPTDFRAAQIFLTYFNHEQDQKPIDAAEVLQKWSKDIQNEISDKLKMRYCPKLTFFNDETTHQILKIEKILSNLSTGEKVLANDEYVEDDIVEEDSN